MKHYTGFSSIIKFEEILDLVIPGGERSSIIYWNTNAGNGRCIDTAMLYDSDTESHSQSDSENELETDEFVLVVMKLMLGLTNLDLAVRFSVSEAQL